MSSSSSLSPTLKEGISVASIQHALPPLTAPRDSTTAASSLVTPYCLALSLPHPPNADPFLDALPYQLLLAEMPSALRHSSRRAIKRRRRLLEEVEEAGMVVEGGLNGARSRGGEEREEETELEARLEQVGALVGANLAERLSRDRPPLSTTLDVLKFVCKDFWTAIWEKQVDGLRTNHRGVYVLTDQAFKPLSRISTSEGPGVTARVAKLYLPHSVGLLRGALGRMGVNATVVAESAIAQGAAGAAKEAVGRAAVQDQRAAITFHVRTAAAAAPPPPPAAS